VKRAQGRNKNKINGLTKKEESICNSGLSIPTIAGNNYLLFIYVRIQQPKVHPASYPLGTAGSFPRGKAARE
jgi:hypothetical protein